MTRSQVNKIEKEAKQELAKVQEEIAAIEAANVWDDAIDNIYYDLLDREEELKAAGKKAWLAWNAGEILKLGGSLRSYNIR